ncbi:response regulator transcription factor [Methylomonas sp. SURF-2]|uniref:Response regulator transcription factor n=1 Tax=Methylomonas subterranea TaxID=2952225 RepID=A0ABT1TII4_9GAMM|nr:response regulator transcription factor [Methylomonas sp. SURF-2]MCQ8104882.1 response regulator transcription factor [Methylomonas sp. SURF-2]
MNILLIEDDPVLTDGLYYSLSKSGFEVTPATTGRYAEALLYAKDFDLIILDLGLPDMDGSHFLSKLRLRKNPIPVLILTAKDAVNDKVECLKKGADDYMVKPFDLHELENRIHALIRRCYGNFSKDIVCGRLTLDTREHRVSLDGNPLILFPKEYALLEFFLLNRGKVLSKDKIAQRLFSDDVISDNTIEVSVHRLRRRLSPYGVNIITLRGLGYMIEDKSIFDATGNE